MSCVDSDITLIVVKTEWELCQFVFDYISGIGLAILVTFNGSCNMYRDDYPGYDIPFL